MVVKSERRASSRYPVHIEVNGQELPSLEYNHDSVLPFSHARTENISEGGLCLVADQRVRQSSLLCCQFTLSEVPIPIPVLMKVQWVRKTEGEKTFRIGLKYLIGGQPVQGASRVAN